jgi:hypothetical protein
LAEILTRSTIREIVLAARGRVGGRNMSKLKEELLAEYGGFADKRIKNIDKGSRFIADDRSSTDFGANRDLLSYFCAIFVDVVSDDTVKVTLARNVPIGPAVTAWIAETGATYNAGANYMTTSLRFSLGRGDQDALVGLANAIPAIVAPGAPRYALANYKYVCPRTHSLWNVSKLL